VDLRGAHHGGLVGWIDAQAVRIFRAHHRKGHAGLHAVGCIADHYLRLTHQRRVVAVVRLLRDSLVFEDGTTLHLARGADRSWLARGPVGGTDFRSHFGPVSYQLTDDAAAHQVHGQVTLTAGRQPDTLQVHVRLPNGEKVTAVDDPAAHLLADGETLEWTHPAAEIHFTATVH
jgi:hypothetical protein